MEKEFDVANNECTWEMCPREILIAIFQYLDPKELLACMLVNKTWRSIADYCGQFYEKWPLLVSNGIYNRGVPFRQRSTLSHRNQFLNCGMWRSVHRAQVKLKHVYNLKEVKNIHVYKDCLIVVCKDSVKYFNLEKGTIVKEIPGSYLDYQETDFLVAEITLREGKKNISLYSKKSDKTYESLGFKIFNVQENKCYVSNFKNCVMLYEWKSGQFTVRNLGRYYSNPRLLTAMYIYEDDMYLFVRKGDIFRYKRGDMHLKSFCTLAVPDLPGSLIIMPTETFMTMFHMCNVVYGVEKKENEMIIKNLDTHGNVHLVLLYANLTCAIEHGDILLLGFKDGKVGIATVKNLWSTDDLTLDFQFYVQDVAQVQDVEPVSYLEVYEGENCHHVVVTTDSNLYQVEIFHADYKKVMP